MLVLLPQPLGAGVAKHVSQDNWSLANHGLQQVLHTLQLLTTVPQADVPFSWPQLCGTVHLQCAMHVFKNSPE